MEGATAWLNDRSASPGLNEGSPDSRRAVADPALIRGIAAYRRHPWQRTVPDPAPIWTEGSARLLDYGQAGAPGIMFVPSLVNRAHILDLLPDLSMMRWFAGQGFRPLLLDWGWPGPAERCFTLTDYVAGTLERALAAGAAACDGPVVLAGYCMGGLLTLAAALRRPELVRALVLLATPWDFRAEHPKQARQLGETLPKLERVMQAAGTLPVDLIQALFAAGDADGIPAKFRAFGASDQTTVNATRFVALEDWLNDGVPLAAPVAREAIGGWYGANTPAAGTWRIADEPVAPERLRMPSFVAIPARDRIVPPGSALALAAMIPGAVVHRPASGHIGMAAGPRAEANLWAPLMDWLRGL